MACCAHNSTGDTVAHCRISVRRAMSQIFPKHITGLLGCVAQQLQRLCCCAKFCCCLLLQIAIVSSATSAWSQVRLWVLVHYQGHINT